MRVIGVDTETYLLAPGVAAPQIVCLSYDDGDVQRVVLRDEAFALFVTWLCDPEVVMVIHHAPFDLGVMAAEAAERGCGMEMLKNIFKAIRERRIRCTKLREQILENARGEMKYDWDEDLEQYKKSIFTLERAVFNRLRDEDGRREFVNKSSDTWRKRYALLDGISIDLWPEEAIKYALKDANLHRRLFLAQEEFAFEEDCEAHADGLADIPGEVATMLAAFALNLMRIWGVRTDPVETAKIRTEFQTKLDAAVKRGRACVTCGEDGGKEGCKKPGCWGPGRKGLVGEKTVTEVKPEYREQYPISKKEDLKRVPAYAKHRVKTHKRKMQPIRDRVSLLYPQHGEDVPMSKPSKKFPGGQVSTDRQTLTFKGRPDWPKDEALMAVADVVRYEKLISTYVPILERGTRWPITPNWNALVESYRTSCGDPNLQNMPRETNVRNCFVPRSGYPYYAIADYDTLELRTLGQFCIDTFGYSLIVEAIKEGRDLHVDLASEMMSIVYDEALALYKAGDPLAGQMRQVCKPGNYGAAGGMGADSFVEFCLAQNIVDEEGRARVTKAIAKRVLQAFRDRWQMHDYFNYFGSLTEEGGEAEVYIHPRTGYLRGKIHYCALCNHVFQHPAAVGAKAALVRVVEECYTMPESPLFGCRAWLFEHDGIGIEVPYYGARAAAAAMRLKLVMEEEMQVLCPDVPIKATATLTRRWFKGAAPVFQDNVLVPCKPEKQGDRTVWVADLELEEERRAA